MTRPLRGFWVFLLGLLGWQAGSVTAQANDAGVLCHPELQGESTRAADVGCIDVLSWSWGASSPASFPVGGPPSAGNPNVQAFSFTKPGDSSSEDLFRTLVTGLQLKGVVEYRQYRDCGVSCQAAEPYLTIRFRTAYIESFQTGTPGASAPIENVSLAAQEISYCYRPTLESGDLDTAQCFAYNVSTQAPVTPF